MKENEVGGTCGMHGIGEWFLQSFGWEDIGIVTDFQ
jgi:hypothetical protein